jgi:hypothetical protein
MHVSERNRLKKVQLALLLAWSDMNQAAAAARALEHETDGTLARALETAMAVCYMRPYTKADLALPNKYVPTDVDAKVIHDDLKTLRDKEYAHTDKESGRRIREFKINITGGIAEVTWGEGWLAYPRSNLPHVISHCEKQAEEFQSDAMTIHVLLQEEPITGGK